MARKKIQEDYAKSLLESYGHWRTLYEIGGRDPFHADGVNLNLVRNHIIYYKRQIEETMPQEAYPEIYYRELPPIVDSDYMALPDEIRESAKESLARYLADPDYQYLCSRIETLSSKDIKKTCIANVIGYATGLEWAIGKDNLVDMRRHRNADMYLGTFASCAQKVRNLKPPENEQLSFLYHYDHEDDETEEDELEL